MGRHSGVALKLGVDDPPLVGVHRLEEHVLFVLDRSPRHLAGEDPERFLALCAVVLDVDLDLDGLFTALDPCASLTRQIHEELDRVERLAVVADEDALVVAHDLDGGVEGRLLGGGEFLSLGRLRG